MSLLGRDSSVILRRHNKIYRMAHPRTMVAVVEVVGVAMEEEVEVEEAKHLAQDRNHNMQREERLRL